MISLSQSIDSYALINDLFFYFCFTEMTRVVREILQLDMSINIYMFHGGTNFGFMNGAFADGLPWPKPMVSNYGMCDKY